MDQDPLKLLILDHASSRNKLELPYLPVTQTFIHNRSVKFTSPLRILNTVRRDSNPASSSSYQGKDESLTSIVKRGLEDREILSCRANPSNIWRDKQDRVIDRLSIQQHKIKSIANEYLITSEIKEEETLLQSSSPNSSTHQNMKSKTFYNTQKKAIYQKKLIGLPYQQEIIRYKKMYPYHHKITTQHDEYTYKPPEAGNTEFITLLPDSIFQFEVKKGQKAKKEKAVMSRIPDFKPITYSKKDLLAETGRTDNRTHSTTSLYENKVSVNMIPDHYSLKASKEVLNRYPIIEPDKKKVKKIKKKTKKTLMANISVADVMNQIEAESEQRKFTTQVGFKRSARAVSKSSTKPPSPRKLNPMRVSQPISSIEKPRPASHIYRNNISAPSSSELVNKVTDILIKKKPPAAPAVADRTDLKSREENINTLLKNRNSLDHDKLMEEYNKRKGLDDKTKIFILHSQDDHIRRIFKKRGWGENKHLTSQAFDLRWSYTDLESDYKSLRSGQLFNHFQNNRELTTKSGICKNLRSVDRYGVDIDSFFPRCYDLGIQAQVEEFKEDFKKQEIYNTVKRHAEYFMQTPEEELCIINTKCLMHAVEYTRNMIDTLNDNCERPEKYSFMPGFDSVFSIAWDDMKHLRYYCIYNLPISSMSHEDMLKTSYSYEIEYVWVKPSPELIQKTIEVHNLMIKTYPQSYMEGHSNVWIVKPGQNARGSGIYCVKDMEAIINSASKLSARVIQKYIEKPLLLPTSKGFCKFDIRQWVLVTSFEPLTIYMYNSSYLRLCQRPYDLNNISDTYSHLANFSLQKNVAKNAEDTVWSLDKFLEHLKAKYPQISWENGILPKIHRMTVYTLEAVAHNIESRTGSFELYGFDIILDEMFVPWLLEVNLSPACSERTPWLTSMLDSMAEGLFEILIEGRSNTPIYDEDLKLQGNIEADSQEWVLVYKAENITHDDKDGQSAKINSCQLEIVGEKLNIRKEKQLERRYQMNRAMTLIQSVIRCFLQKRRYIRYSQSLSQSALKIQRWYRQILTQKAFAYKKLQEDAISLSCKISIQNF